MSNKRKRPDNHQFLVELEDLRLNLQHQGGLDLVTDAIWKLADGCGLTFKDLKKRKTGAPSFSNATWKEVAPMFNLEPSKNFQQLPIFTFPMASLPPSFHREVMKASAKWLDVYQERGAHDPESARVRLMDVVRAFLIHSQTDN
jgi:hypothetical protein